MMWVRIDCLARGHRKHLAAGAEASWLWACGLMWCNSQKAHDGVIPAYAVPSLYPFAEKKLRQLVAKLIEVGLWERRAKGDLQIHDYNEFQLSAEEIAERKAEKSRAGRIGARVRWGKNLDEAPAMAGAMAPAMAKQCSGLDPGLGPTPDLNSDPPERESLSLLSSSKLKVERGMPLPAACAHIAQMRGLAPEHHAGCFDKFVNQIIREKKRPETGAELEAAFDTWVMREVEYRATRTPVAKVLKQPAPPSREPLRSFDFTGAARGGRT